MSELNQDTDSGQFLPGNVWRFKQGKSGHTPRFSAATMRQQTIECVQYCKAEEKPLTWSGLASFLGLSRNGLDLYRKGKVGAKSQLAAIRDTLLGFETLLEQQYEEKLIDSPQGIQKALAAIDQRKWGDTKEVQQQSVPSIQVILSPGPLTDRLEQHGVTVQHAAIGHES